VSGHAAQAMAVTTNGSAGNPPSARLLHFRAVHVRPRHEDLLSAPAPHIRSDAREAQLARRAGRGGCPAGRDPADLPAGGRRGCLRRLHVRHARQARPDDRVTPASQRTRAKKPTSRPSSAHHGWSRHSDLNRGPAVWETASGRLVVTLTPCVVVICLGCESVVDRSRERVGVTRLDNTDSPMPA
jgi:hypothetical protein